MEIPFHIVTKKMDKINRATISLKSGNGAGAGTYPFATSFMGHNSDVR